MITLIRNEIRKLLRRKKTLVTLIAFVLLVIVMCFGMYKNKENIKKYNSPEFRIENCEQNIESMKQQRDNTSTSEEEKKNLDQMIVDQETELENLKKEQLVKSGEKDWKEALKSETAGMKENLNNTKDPQEKEYLNSQIKVNEYLINNNIKPQDYTAIKAFPFLKDTFSFLGLIFLAVGVAVFSADMVSGEYTPPTMKVLLTQPVSRGKVLLSKYISVILTSVMLILSVEVAAFLVMGIIFGFGNPQYPIMVGAKYKFDTFNITNGGYALKLVLGSTYILSAWKFTMEMLLLQTLFIIAVASFAFMLSTIMKSSMISVSISIVAIIACTILGNIPFLRKYIAYVFTSYGDVAAILTGDGALNYQNPEITTMFAVTVLLVWTIVCYIISHIVFVKKDILI